MIRQRMNHNEWQRGVSNDNSIADDIIMMMMKGHNVLQISFREINRLLVFFYQCLGRYRQMIMCVVCGRYRQMVMCSLLVDRSRRLCVVVWQIEAGDYVCSVLVDRSRRLCVVYWQIEADDYVCSGLVDRGRRLCVQCFGRYRQVIMCSGLVDISRRLCVVFWQIEAGDYVQCVVDRSRRLCVQCVGRQKQAIVSVVSGRYVYLYTCVCIELLYRLRVSDIYTYVRDIQCMRYSYFVNKTL